LSAPANGAIDQPTAVTLTWMALTNATSYHVQVSSSSSFSLIVAEDSTLTAATKSITGLANGTTYYWRVNAKNAGGAGLWSQTWNFKVVNLAVVLPSAPVLSAPANEATYQLWFSTQFTWLPAAGAITYDFQISSKNTFDSLILFDSLRTATGDTLQAYLNGSTAYYWRVRSVNANGAGQWSPTWSFTTTTQFQGIWEGSRKVNNDSWRYVFRNDTLRISTLKLDFINDVVDTIPTYQGLFNFDSTNGRFDIQLMDSTFSTPTGQTIQTLYNWIGGVGSFIQFELMENDPGAPRPADMSDLNTKITFYFKDY
jgi:hypothetical protein